MPFGNNNDQSSGKNILIALSIFVLFMIAYTYFFDNVHQRQSSSEQAETTNQAAEISIDGESLESPVDEELTLAESLSRNSRIHFENEKVSGSIDLIGGIIDEFALKKYKETTDANSSNVMLLVPRKTKSESYYTISYKDKTHNEMISSETVWTEVHSATQGSITIKTQTQNGMIIERTIVVDDGFLVYVKDKIINVSDKDLKVSATSDLIRVNPKHNNYAVVHDGLVGCFENKVEEVKYSNIQNKIAANDCNWLGYTDIYWLCAIINKDKNTSVSYSKFAEDSYKCSTHSKKDIKIKPNSITEISYAIFAGPKDIKILNEYADRLELNKFEMSIDFGWFFMLTKPLLYLLECLGQVLPSMWLVILVLTLLFKILTFPLMQKSFASAARIRELQPKIAALQKLYANDKVRMNQEMMLLYKKEKVSPMSGCFPMLLQAPIFFCLYKVFFISIDMRHAPLFGWIHDLSAPDPVYIFNLFGLIDWTLPGFLRIGIWPLIMGTTMFLQQKFSTGMNGKKGGNTEKTSEMKIQENMMLLMPVLFTYICASFPVGVVIYWTISNLFSMAQQYYVNSNGSKKK
ncbi:MAG: membrane protein insertase YidC [Holosporales bacterium]|jgi:YidC/Oxa1 family membrane protein insertase|nr:membrane protein insertase YidC [Holosporales bacterium]